MGRSRPARQRPNRLLAAAAAAAAAAGAAASLGGADGAARRVGANPDPSDHVVAGRREPQEPPHLRRVSERLEPGAYRGFSAYLMDDVPRDGQDCTPSSLWTKEVDVSYDLGCEEIQNLLETTAILLGEGRVRQVFLAEYDGKPVAVKVLQRQGDIRLHRIEVATMNAARGNPNAVQALGMCNTTLVTEAFPEDIQQAIRKRTEPLSINEAVAMSLDAITGLRALHEAAEGPIVHYDVKPAQLLVTNEGRVKLNDFNVAWFMSTGDDGSPCAFNVRGDARQPGPWRTPEYLSGKPMTEKVDIYRMGLVFQKHIAQEGLHALATSGGLDGADGAHTMWHKSYKEVVEDMIDEDPERRPSAGEVASRLEEILRILRMKH
ncbi:unnamed protein product [Scytosiphon promiscuus]